jgi:hypothetical protein
MNAAYPTQYAGAFRSGFLANIAPDLPTPIPAAGYGLVGLRGSRSDATSMYRPNPTVAAEPAFLGQTPNLRQYQGGPTSQTALLGKYQQADRQNYIALQRMMRLPNLVSQQSNVFSVHMTIGFFEYDPIHGLGPEHVGTSGETKRHRAYYIIDRSVPVGYRTGEDLNTEKTILLRRYIK